MRTISTIKAAIVAAATVAMVAGCANGASSLTPGGPQVLSSASHGRGSWVAPEAKTAPSLLYVIGGNTSGKPVINIYSYPQGKLEGVIQNGATSGSICSDKTGNVYVPITDGVQVYAHGATTPLRTLSYPGIAPVGCSFDTTTGNLAVTGNDGDCTECPGYIAIYKNAQGDPVLYQADLTAPEFKRLNFYFYCAYDNNGNLFFNGITDSQAAPLHANYRWRLLEMHKGYANGNATFTNYTINNSSLNMGPIEWDGKYLALEGSSVETPSEKTLPSAIYQLKFNGPFATIEHTVVPTGAYFNSLDGQEFFLTNAPGTKGAGQPVVIAPVSPGGSGTGFSGKLGVFDYPQGGAATKTIRLPDMTGTSPGLAAFTLSTIGN